MPKLFDHQKRILNKNPERLLIAHGTGTGKTLTALALLRRNKEVGLVIVPKQLKKQWHRQAILFEVSHLVHIISKEEFKKDWAKLPAYNAIVVDEFHYFGNLKSQLSKALINYQNKHKPKYFWGLTATPYLSTPMNIYALATHLGYRWNYWAFQNRFFSMVKFGRKRVPVVKPGIEDDIAELVRNIGDVVGLEEVATDNNLGDLPEQITEVEVFGLTNEQKKAIAEIQETEFIARWTKKHEIEQGFIYGNEYDDFVYKKLPCDKTERIKDLVQERNKVAVFCRYNAQIDYLKEELSTICPHILVINGKTKDKDAVVQEVEKLDKCVVLINSACSEGYELPSVGLIVFASLSFSFKDFTQAKGRFLRANKLKRNVFVVLVSDGVDQDVWGAIQRKQDFNMAIYEKELSTDRA